jgi:hypothetical protein
MGQCADSDGIGGIKANCGLQVEAIVSLYPDILDFDLVSIVASQVRGYIHQTNRVIELIPGLRIA